MASQAMFRIWRGDSTGGKFVDYTTEITEGLVVLDVVHKIQATQANDLACRWNCKAGKCGSCSAEVNGMPKLMCMTRMDTLDITKCCTKVCPEHITITDNAIIPLKERVVDEYYDPLGWLWKKIRPKG